MSDVVRIVKRVFAPDGWNEPPLEPLPLGRRAGPFSSEDLFGDVDPFDSDEIFGLPKGSKFNAYRDLLLMDIELVEQPVPARARRRRGDKSAAGVSRKRRA